MPELLAEPETLRAKLKRLDVARREGRLDGAAIEAIAEASFRLAAHPKTPPTEAILLLRRACRIDGTNPKHAYLLARLYFLHGDLDRAARWLATAVRHCPTSHRVWTHVALLQLELNGRYPRSDKFEPDDLRRRGAEILGQVRAGGDGFTVEQLQFKPRPSAAAQEAKAGTARQATSTQESPREPEPAGEGAPIGSAERLLDPGRCRWGGVHALLLEELLEGTASEHLRPRVTPLLRQAARVAGERPGAVGAFAILGVQWCVAGYPVATVRRLRRLLSPDLKLHSIALLDLVCDLFELEEAAFVDKLAESVAEHRLPPTLAAIIHHRRLLWQPVELRALVGHRAACRFLAGARDAADEPTAAWRKERARELTKGLEQAVQSLAPKPRPVLHDPACAEPLSPLAAPDAEAILASSEDASRRLLDARVAAVRLLKFHETAHEGFVMFARTLEAAAEAGSSRLDDLMARAFSAEPGALPKSFRSRAAACRRRFNYILYFEPFLGRLRQPENSSSETTPPPAELTALLKQVDGLFGADGRDAGAAINPTELLLQLEIEARETKARLDSDGARLTLHLESHKKGTLDAAGLAQCAAIAQFAANLDVQAQARLKELAALRAAKGIKGISEAEKKALRDSGKASPLDDLERLDATEAAFRDLARRPGSIQKRLRPLPLPKVSAVAPMPVTTGLEAKPSQPVALPADAIPLASPAATSPLAAPHPTDPTGLLDLNEAKEKLEAQVERWFRDALNTFATLAPVDQAQPAMAALRWTVRARHAEALFRLGQRTAARRVWSSLLREDRLNIAILHNLAVCDTGGPEAGRELAAWRAYSEMLYFHDVVADNPRTRANERAGFHRQFGSAYAPSFLLQPEDKEKEPDTDPVAMLSFLDSPARVRAFVGHKMLEWFNAKLDYSSPPVLLGCRRDDPPKVRAAAQARVLAFVERSCAALPPSVQKSFMEIVRRQVETAATACADAKRLTAEADPAYKEEFDRHLKWVTEICQLKYRIFLALKDGEDIARHMTSVAFLDELLRLDEAPIDLSGAVITAVARQWQMDDPEPLIKLMGQARDRLLNHLFEFLNAQDGDDVDRSLRERQLQRLADEWSHRPSVASFERLEGLLLDKAKLASEKGDLARTFSLAMAAVRMDCRMAAVVQNALHHVLEASKRARRNSHHLQIDQSVSSWAQRAREHLARPPSDADDKANEKLTEKDIQEVEEALRQVLVQLCLAPFGELDASTDWPAIRQAMADLIHHHPTTRAIRMVALYNLAGSALKASLREVATGFLRESLSDAEVVAADTKASEEDRKRAGKLKKEIANILGQT